jgi:hypothetical protein
VVAKDDDTVVKIANIVTTITTESLAVLFVAVSIAYLRE